MGNLPIMRNHTIKHWILELQHLNKTKCVSYKGAGWKCTDGVNQGGSQ